MDGDAVYKKIKSMLIYSTNNLEKTITNKNIAEKSYSQVVENFNLMSTADKVDKNAEVVNGVEGYITKFQSDDSLEVMSGALDIATALLSFVPPPFSMVTGNCLYLLYRKLMLKPKVSMFLL